MQSRTHLRHPAKGTTPCTHRSSPTGVYQTTSGPGSLAPGTQKWQNFSQADKILLRPAPNVLSFFRSLLVGMPRPERPKGRPNLIQIRTDGTPMTKNTRNYQKLQILILTTPLTFPTRRSNSGCPIPFVICTGFGASRIAPPCGKGRGGGQNKDFEL